MQPPDLLFQWLVREGRGLRLFVAGCGMILALVAFVLLFQVVYPTAGRRPLTPQRILILDHNSAAARPILDAVNDRDFLQLHSSSNTAPQLAAHAPVFVPSFKDFQFRPRDFLESSPITASTALPRLFRPDHPPLPPLPKAKSAPPVNPTAPSRELRPLVTEGLSNRSMLKTISLSGTANMLAEGTSYRVAVNARGLITLVIPISDPTAQAETVAAFKAVRDQLDLVRFEPADGAELQWGTVTLRWQDSSKTAP